MIKPTMSIISRKVCLVGNFGVGKTSLIRRFVDRQFSDQYLSTVGVKISRKLMELAPAAAGQESHSLQFLVWDIEGSTRFKAIAPTYLQGAKGAVIVGDVTRQETLDQIPEHSHNFLTINPKGFVVVALNKSDLIDAEKLDRLLQQVQLQPEQRILGARATSAKTGNNVDSLFQTLAHRLLDPNELPV
jgi:small GTP-binding protein